MATPEQQHEANIVRLEQFHGDARERMARTSEAALAAIRYGILLNGGALVSAFTLLGHVDDLRINAGLLWTGFSAYAAGLVMAAIASILAYLIHEHIFAIEWRLADSCYSSIVRDRDTDLPEVRPMKWKSIVAIALVFGSIVCFAVGSGFSLRAVTLKPVETTKGPTAERQPGVDGAAG